MKHKNLKVQATLPKKLLGLYTSVHRNLHKRCWSVTHKGKVVAWVLNLTLSGCTMKVSQAGRNRVLKEKRKNVHAKVFGQTVSAMSMSDRVIFRCLPLSYNPYKYGQFVSDEYAVYSADFVQFAKYRADIYGRCDTQRLPKRLR